MTRGTFLRGARMTLAAAVAVTMASSSTSTWSPIPGISMSEPMRKASNTVVMPEPAIWVSCACSAAIWSQ